MSYMWKKKKRKLEPSPNICRGPGADRSWTKQKIIVLLADLKGSLILSAKSCERSGGGALEPVIWQVLSSHLPVIITQMVPHFHNLFSNCSFPSHRVYEMGVTTPGLQMKPKERPFGERAGVKAKGLWFQSRTPDTVTLGKYNCLC